MNKEFTLGSITFDCQCLCHKPWSGIIQPTCFCSCYNNSALKIKTYINWKGYKPSTHQWQPIETAPIDEEVLVFDGDEILIAYKNDDGYWIHSYTPSTERLLPSHWMPLPEPPEEKC